MARYPQITDILTSGAHQSAPEGRERITALEHLTSEQFISILAGSGLSIEGLSEFISDTGVVHFQSAVREGGNPLKPIDPERLQAVRILLNH